VQLHTLAVFVVRYRVVRRAMLATMWTHLEPLLFDNGDRRSGRRGTFGPGSHRPTLDAAVTGGADGAAQPTGLPPELLERTVQRSQLWQQHQSPPRPRRLLGYGEVALPRSEQEG